MGFRCCQSFAPPRFAAGPWQILMPFTLFSLSWPEAKIDRPASERSPAPPVAACPCHRRDGGTLSGRWRMASPEGWIWFIIVSKRNMAGSADWC
jgi:hypothetical protein